MSGDGAPTEIANTPALCPAIVEPIENWGIMPPESIIPYVEPKESPPQAEHPSPTWLGPEPGMFAATEFWTTSMRTLETAKLAYPPENPVANGASIVLSPVHIS